MNAVARFAKRWAPVACAAAAYVALRFAFNREYSGARWGALVDGVAKLPFGHRVLIPQLVRPWVEAGLPIPAAFALTEWVATLATIAGLRAALGAWLEPRAAVVAAGGFFGVMGLAYLLAFKWAIFYPWDTPALATMAWGLAWAQRRQFGRLLLLTAVGAANRESALLLPFAAVLLHAHDERVRPKVVPWASLMLVLAVAVRFAIALAWPDNAGPAVSLRVPGTWRVLHNFAWLSKPSRTFRILGAVSMLPALWWWLRRWMPRPVRRLELLWVGACLALLVVANVYEPRAFGEPLVLAYLGVAVGVTGWIADSEPPLDVRPTWLVQADRWMLTVGVGIWAVGVAWLTAC